MSSSIKNKKYILWDNDGVLVETEPWFFKANQLALAELSINLSEEKYMEFMHQGGSAWSLAAEQGVDIKTIQAQKEKRDAFYQEFLQTKNLEIPGVSEVLAALKEKFRMAIVTTSKKVDFELIHTGRSFLQFMDFYLTREDYSHSKPSPDPYLLGMQRFQAAGSDCIAIEDSARGLKAAIAAGIDCVLIKNAFTRSHNFSGALCMLDNIRKLPELLL